ncbi:MAG: hypothetical protein ACREWG_09290 [Gammaproteobacteria bacterium]
MPSFNELLLISVALAATYVLIGLLPAGVTDKVRCLFLVVLPRPGERKSRYFLRRFLVSSLWTVIFWMTTQLGYYASEYLSRRWAPGPAAFSIIATCTEVLTGLAGVTACISLILCLSSGWSGRDGRYDPERGAFPDPP